MAVAKEKVEQAKVKKFLKTKLRAYAVKTINTAENGTPDLIGCFRGVFFGVEMKRVGKKTAESFGATPLQNEKLGDIVRAGGIAFVAETLEEFKHIFYNELIRKGIDPRPMN